MTVAWAVLRLNGVASPANALYSADELAHQLKTSRCKALFTVEALLPTALKAAKTVGISNNRIYIVEIPGDKPNSEATNGFKTFRQLLRQGEGLPALEPVIWKPGQGERQIAFLCYSSGTSGLPVSRKALNSIWMLCYHGKAADFDSQRKQ